MRESGYYWVRLKPKSAWAIAQCYTDGWVYYQVSCMESDFCEINPQRILNPDEQLDQPTNNAEKV